MRKLLLALVFIQVLFSCGKKVNEPADPIEPAGSNEYTGQPYLKFYQAKISIPAFISVSEDFTIQSNIDWQISVSPGSDWLQLSKYSGHGTETIHFSINKNSSGLARTAIITATVTTPGLNLTTQLTVEQKTYNVEVLSQKILKGRLTNYFNAIVPDLEGGYLAVGSNNFTGFPPLGFGAAWMVKLNAAGDTVWTRTMATGGISEDDVANAAIATPDGGFIVGGTTFNIGRPDWWLIKLKSNGDTAWTRVIGDFESFEYLTCLVPASNGDFIAGGNISNPSGSMLIARFDKNGNKIWEKNLGLTNSTVKSMSASPNGSLFVTASTTVNNRNTDYRIIKLDANGNQIWNKVLGSSVSDEPASIQSTADGGCIVAGSSEGSEDGNVTDKNHSSNSDLWIVKLNASGDITWNKLLGGSGTEYIYPNAGIAVTPGGYVFAGTSNSPDGDVGAKQGSIGSWVFKLNNWGQLLWTRTFAEPRVNLARALVMNTDGAFWVAGSMVPDNGYPTDDNSDGWLLKFKDSN